MGDEVQAIKAGLLEVADIVVVNKGDSPGAADGGPASGDARRRRAAPSWRGDRIGRARSARSPDHDRRDRGRRARAPRSAGPPSCCRPDGGVVGRPARAGRSQVLAIVAERLRGRAAVARSPSATDEVLAEVAEHRLDPYSAADLLLESLEPAAGIDGVDWLKGLCANSIKREDVYHEAQPRAVGSLAVHSTDHRALFAVLTRHPAPPRATRPPRRPFVRRVTRPTGQMQPSASLVAALALATGSGSTDTLCLFWGRVERPTSPSARQATLGKRHSTVDK